MGRMRPILVVGSLNMDLVVHVQRHPRPGDTVLGSDTQLFLGGKGANQAVAAAKAGGQVRMMGRVGNDVYSPQLISNLSDAGVDTGYVTEYDGPSGIAYITVSEDGENTIVVSSGANRRLQPEDLEASAFENAAALLMQLESPLETVLSAAQKANRLSLPIILNAAPAQDLPPELLQIVNYLIVNEGEAEDLSGVPVEDSETALSAAQALRGKGLSNVIVTLGAAGVVWLGEEGPGKQPAFEVEVIDTTAAGDAFCGAFAVKIVEGTSLPEAVRFASAAGALAATREGAQPSLPARTSIEALLATSA